MTLNLELPITNGTFIMPVMKYIQKHLLLIKTMIKIFISSLCYMKRFKIVIVQSKKLRGWENE